MTVIQEFTTTLQHVWGFKEFIGLQHSVIKSISAGHETIAILPTGSGKSLCYQFPVVHNNGFAVVISPLIALMADQVQNLQQLGIEARAMNSSLESWEFADVKQQVLSRNLQLLYLSPERLLQDSTLSLLKQSQPDYIAIDEAHCVSQWGHDFRPDYRKLAELREHLPGIPFHCFTATATPKVQEDIARQLKMKKANTIVGSFDRPNLVYRVQERSNLNDQITEFMRERPGQSGIIYAISRKDTEKIAADLRANGFRAQAYHAGLETQKRTEIQNLFTREDLDAVVATVAFGMGIDRSNVRFVLHAGLPKSIENYQQEAGRAGRDGLEAECWLFYKKGDKNKWRYIVDNSFDSIDFPTPEQRDNHRESMQKLQEMFEFASGSMCRHRYLVNYFGQDFKIKNCGACDICLAGLEGDDSLLSPEDANVVARKIIGAAFRAKGKGGRSYVAEILMGVPSERVIKYELDKTISYGALNDRTQSRIIYWIGLLIDAGYLTRNDQGRVLATDNGIEFAKTGDGDVKLPRFAVAELKPAEVPKAQTSAQKKAASLKQLEGDELTVFEELRKLRKTIADGMKIAPYQVFSDKTLIDIARNKPESAEEFMACFGVGHVKLKKFGKPFLYRLKQLYNGVI